MADKVTYIGHATVALELGETKLVTDPLLRNRFLHVHRHAPPVAPDALAGVDAILISHLHPDHLDFASLRGLDPQTRFIVLAGGGSLLRRHGFKTVSEVAKGDSVRVGEVEIVATDAVHDGRRLPLGPRRRAVGYDIRGPDHRAYFAGDTDLFPGMSELASETVDVALLPIAGWGPNLRGGHLDPRKAAQAAARIKPRFVVPIHWGTYLRAGLIRTQPELLSEPPKRLIAELAEHAPDTEAKVLRPGEAFEL